MTRRFQVALAVLMLSVPADAGEKKVTHMVGRSSFTLNLPDGYAPHTEASPMPGLNIIGFATEPRPDGTRGMVQVSIFDFEVMKTGPVELERLAAQMIGAVRSRRKKWQATEVRIEASGVPAIRVDWSGESGAGPDTPAQLAPARRMRGIMITGIKDEIGFSLHTQDMEPITQTAIPLGEKALLSFDLKGREN